MKKVLIIGLDGATWEVLDPLVERGHMPNLARLKKKGSSGTLMSTVPPITAPAWASFQTGVNPGKHGIFDFSVFDLEKRKVDLVDSTFLKKETIWEKAAQAGKRVVTINLPLTYPPKKIPGWIQIGGPLSGTLSSEFFYPSWVGEKIKEYNYEISACGLEVRANHSLGQAVDRFIEVEEKRYALALELLEAGKWDLFMVHNQSMDSVQHCFYHYLDWNDPESRQEREEVARFYEFCDRQIGRMVEAAGEGTVLFVVSDHGFKRVRRLINLNILLAQEGYLSFSSRYFLKKGLDLVRKLDLFNLEERFVEGLVLRNKGLRKDLFSLGNTFINWSDTRAYMGSGSIYGNVYLLDKGLKKEIKGLLRKLEDPATGEKVVSRIWDKKEIYEGPYLDQLPDLCIQPARDYAFKTNLLLRETELFRPVDPEKESTGTHARKGIFVINRGLSSETGSEIDLVDLRPTMAKILGLTAFQDMDGEPLLFEEEP